MCNYVTWSTGYNRKNSETTHGKVIQILIHAYDQVSCSHESNISENYLKTWENTMVKC